MGGWGSGRRADHALVEDALTLNLPRMFRRRWIQDGHCDKGMLRFSQWGTVYASVSYSYDLAGENEGWLRLNYTRRLTGQDRARVEQLIRLEFTEPHFGGRRWWMICPSGGQRVAKLYLPPGGDRFASRQEWRLVYSSQRYNRKAAAKQIARWRQA